MTLLASLTRYTVPRYLLAVWTALAATLVPASLSHALDAAPWDAVLSAHAHRGGFDYAAAKDDPETTAQLERFLGQVASMPQSAPLASWLNAYNALVVKSVLDHYPITSVRSVNGFFDARTHRVAGRTLTLDAIENQIIRQRFPDARVHAALNCAAVSCPALYPQAFQTGSLDRVLDRLAQRFANSRQHVRFRNGELQVSELFFWFEADFSRDAGSPRAWIEQRAGDRLQEVPADAPLARIRYRWRLNDRPRNTAQ